MTIELKPEDIANNFMEAYELHIMLNVEITRRKMLHFAINSKGETQYSSWKAADIFNFAALNEYTKVLVWTAEGNPIDITINATVDTEQHELFDWSAINETDISAEMGRP